MAEHTQLLLFPEDAASSQPRRYPFRWLEGHTDGYEVSSRGDRRFSAFWAVLPKGTQVCLPTAIRPLRQQATIEEVYQIGVKGYTDVRSGKAKPPRHPISRLQQTLFYYELWRTWTALNPLLMEELRSKGLAKGGLLTDCFARSPINQAAMLAHLLNHREGAFTTKVVHQKKSPCTVQIGRPSIWGNPFTHQQQKDTQAQYKVATREEAIASHRQFLLYQPELIERLPTLAGQILGCWCKPLACHGDTLAEWAELTQLC